MSSESSHEVPDTGIRKIVGEAPLPVPGLRTAAVRSGVKPSGEPDLALLDMGTPVTTVAVFTTNELCAPPVSICRERLDRDPRARAVVINSGNANAMTGRRGAADARAMLDRVEQRVGAPALVLSTGVIGVPLPLDKVLNGIDEAAARLDEGQGEEVARAMLTTDTCTKTSAREVRLPAEVRATTRSRHASMRPALPSKRIAPSAFFMRTDETAVEAGAFGLG